MKSILILEDCPLLTLLYKKSIEIGLSDKVSCTTTTYVAQAKELVKLNKFDLMVLDYNLPDGTAREFLSYCRNSKVRYPAIIISSESSVFVAENVSEFSNVYGNFQKPLGISDFVSLINHSLSSSNKYHVDRRWMEDLCQA